LDNCISNPSMTISFALLKVNYIVKNGKYAINPFILVLFIPH
jgi:hypothetical protein